MFLSLALSRRWAIVPTFFASRLIDGDNGFAGIHWRPTHVGFFFFFEQPRDDTFHAQVAKAKGARDMDEKSGVSSRWKKDMKVPEALKRTPRNPTACTTDTWPSLHRQSYKTSPICHRLLTIINRLAVFTKVSRGLLQSFVNPFRWCGAVGWVGFGDMLKIGGYPGWFWIWALPCSPSMHYTVGGFVCLWCWSGAIVRCSPMSFPFSLCLFLWGFVFKIGGSLRRVLSLGRVMLVESFVLEVRFLFRFSFLSRWSGGMLCCSPLSWCLWCYLINPSKTWQFEEGIISRYICECLR